MAGGGGHRWLLSVLRSGYQVAPPKSGDAASHCSAAPPLRTHTQLSDVPGFALNLQTGTLYGYRPSALARTDGTARWRLPYSADLECDTIARDSVAKRALPRQL